MAANVPQWADRQASSQLKEWIAAGESHSREFKKCVPDQVRKLAQEVAALATSGGGQVFIGVSDDGELVGIDQAADARDSLVERVQGVIDTIRPNVSADLLFAVADSTAVLLINVCKQMEPVFYVDHRPYVRDNRRSRPARPAEVVEKVWEHPCSNERLKREQIKTEQLRALAQSSNDYLEDSRESRLGYLHRRT